MMKNILYVTLILITCPIGYYLGTRSAPGRGEPIVSTDTTHDLTKDTSTETGKDTITIVENTTKPDGTVSTTTTTEVKVVAKTDTKTEDRTETKTIFAPKKPYRLGVGTYIGFTRADLSPLSKDNYYVTLSRRFGQSDLLLDITYEHVINSSNQTQTGFLIGVSYDF